jgi:hypothetical protein
MKSFVVFAVAFVCAQASPQFLVNPTWNGFGYTNVGHLGYAAAPGVHYAAAPAIIAPAFTKTQYHAQDEFGQSSHGYAHPGQAAAEVRDAFGNVRGSYSYVDPNGKVVQTSYVADAVNGFRVASNALPIGPAVPDTPALIAPLPVQDTPEVAAARAEHARAIEEAKARNAAADVADAAKPVESRKKRGLAYTYPVATHGYSTLTYGAPLAYHTAVASPVTYAAAPVAVAAAHPVTYTAAHPVTYAAVAAAHPVTYSAAVVPALRTATLTKVVNNPGHAVSYRVD